MSSSPSSLPPPQNKTLIKLRLLRRILCRMRPYITSCPAFNRLVPLFGGRLYYMETAEMWSLCDLADVRCRQPPRTPSPL